MGDGYGGQWTAEERIRRWEPSFPRGTDLRFIRALEDQTPRAWATPLVLGLNAVVFVAMILAGVDPWHPAASDLIRSGANYGPLTTAGEPARLLTSAFVHFGVLHFLVSMVLLWQVGFLVERLVGNWGFLIAYLVSAVCSSVAWIAWNPYVPQAGASGAVVGMCGVFVGYLSANRGAIPAGVVARTRAVALVFGGAIVALVALRIGLDLVTPLVGLFVGVCAGRLLARPFGKPTDERTVGRSLSLLGGGLAVAALALVVMPRAVDLRAEMADLYTMQAETSRLYESARWRRREHTLSDADFVKIVDEQLRPVWREHLQRLRDLPRLRGRAKELMADTERYLDLRERSWAKASEAVRSGDAAQLAEAQALEGQAQGMARSFSEPSDRRFIRGYRGLF